MRILIIRSESIFTMKFEVKVKKNDRTFGSHSRSKKMKSYAVFVRTTINFFA